MVANSALILIQFSTQSSVFHSQTCISIDHNEAGFLKLLLITIKAAGWPIAAAPEISWLNATKCSRKTQEDSACGGVASTAHDPCRGSFRSSLLDSAWKLDKDRDMTGVVDGLVISTSTFELPEILVQTLVLMP